MAEQPVPEVQETEGPTMDKVVTALCDRLNRMQIDFATMCKFHNESMARIDDLSKKVDKIIPELEVRKPDSQHNQQKGSPVTEHDVPPGDEPPIVEIATPVRKSMEETRETHPFQRPPHRIPGLRPVPADISELDLPYVEGLPERTLRQALEGQYVQIDHFLENIVYDIEGEGALEVITGEEGQIACRQKRGRRGVYNLVSWLEAFENYTRVMVNFHGVNLFNSFSAYKTVIIDYDRMYLWKAVHKFDMRHRNRKGGRSVDFHNIDLLLAGLIMNNLVMKTEATRCSICGDFKHIYQACPFQDAPGAQSRGSGRRSTSLVHASSHAANHTSHKTNEICFN